jgi:hypothetical protein
VVGCYNGYTLWHHVFFCSYINGLNEKYPELFDGDGTSSQHQINFGKKWKAYATIVELANGNVKEIDGVTKEPLEKCLMLLAYKSDKVQLEGLMHKEALNSMK